jgi:RNA polymerase sigma-70 factor (ECF subfamily)
VKFSDLSPSELFSICADRGEALCWEEFIRRFNPVIACTIIRIAARYARSDKPLIDDLVQETYLKICANECKLLRTFTPHHPDSAFGFLKVIAASVAQDFFKSRLADKRAPEAIADSIEETADKSGPQPTKDALSAAERSVLIEQIDRKLSTAVPADELRRARTVFWLYYRSGFTASAIASMPAIGLTTKGVESLLFRLTRLVREKLSNGKDSGAQSKKGFQQAESF